MLTVYFNSNDIKLTGDRNGGINWLDIRQNDIAISIALKSDDDIRTLICELQKLLPHRQVVPQELIGDPCPRV